MNLDSLLISRDASLLGVLRPALEDVSVEVKISAESAAGSDLLAREKFDAVIIDCDDLENGFEILRTLRGSRSNTKSVAFAVVNGKTTTQAAFHAGANFVLQKPVTPLQAARCFNAALNFMVRERRRYFRQPLEMPVRITYPGLPELNGSATNLSEGGMALRVSGKMPKELEARIRFTLPDTSFPLELRGKLAWGDGCGHAGISFIEVPQSSQHELEKWLNARLQEEMPSRLQPYAALP